MKKFLFLFTLMLTIQQNMVAQCNSGSYTVTSNLVISGSCVITGDLTILNGATLTVDLTSAAVDTFVVRGNILLKGNAVLWVHAAAGSTGEQFIVSNSYNNQRTITTEDSSQIKLEYIEFKTQEGNLTNAVSLYMNYYAQDHSTFYINKSWLDTQTAWLLCNLNNKSRLIGYEPNHVPTETYLQDTAQIALHGPGTNAGLWLSFESITDTLNLPPDRTGPFTLKIGRGAGGLATPWYLEVDTALVGLGVQIFPTAKMTINGSGLPATGELKVALLFSNNTDNIKNLKVGLQNTTVANGPEGRVTLNNVNLGPIAWQLYALINENLHVQNSIVNEIGIAGPSQITVDSSVLQFALLAAVGIGGSKLTINSSSIWSQYITAANNSSIILNNCYVTGSEFRTTDALSRITVNGGCFFANPSGCTESVMVNITTGQPYCNPFIPAGLPQNLTPVAITFNGVNDNCVTGLKKETDAVTIYPNPTKDFFKVSDADGQSIEIKIIDMNGRVIWQSDSIYNDDAIGVASFASGMYFVRIITSDSVYIEKLIVQK